MQENTWAWLRDSLLARARFKQPSPHIFLHFWTTNLQLNKRLSRVVKGDCEKSPQRGRRLRKCAARLVKTKRLNLGQGKLASSFCMAEMNPNTAAGVDAPLNLQTLTL